MFDYKNIRMKKHFAALFNPITGGGGGANRPPG